MKNIDMNHVRNISILGKNPYSTRYIGSILLYSEISAYPVTDGRKRVLDIVLESIHSGCPIFLG
ncbi:166_t:CDS:2 [Entrophospora sp. SA101]|nr:1962_t:CDS:2 [Entrophospora sp. SA101]CAJ0883128.1 1979_t:CDS:2 [Entrophospora sp. SA101]CAJ0906916.1 166_t:CDS:2 [Entrophospora sp. SA101]